MNHTRDDQPEPVDDDRDAKSPASQARADTETDDGQDDEAEDPLFTEIHEIWDVLQQGEIEQARALVEALVQREGHEPEVMALRAAVLTARGLITEALAELLRAAQAAPEGEGARYLLDAAELCLYADDNPEEAAKLCSKALDMTTDEHELIDGVLINVEALMALGNRDEEARALLAELDHTSIDDPAVCCRVGDLYATLAEWRRAEQAFLAALELDPDYADAHHGLGGAYEAEERRDVMIASWLRVLELDRREETPPWRLSAAELEKVVEDALEELPSEVHGYLENVPIFVEEAPSEDMVREGLDPRLLGLFSGVPLPERSHLTEGQVPAIDMIHVFQANLERVSLDQEHLKQELRTTILHETAHFFGLEDHHLDDIGLG